MMNSRTKGGFYEAFLDAQTGRAAQAMRTWREIRGQGMAGWAELPYNQDVVVGEIEQYAADVRGRFNALVVFGIGGSSLGPLAVHQALNHLHYNELASTKVRFYVEDNIDPERMAALLDVIDPETTLFNVVSKSGETPETLSQFMIIRDILRRRMPETHQEHIVCTCGEKGSLADCARAAGYRMFIIPEGVGGRFSQLCPVGLLPAAICGIDIRELLRGAARADAWCLGEDLRQNPALLAALMQTEATRQGRTVSVMMPYADRLRMTADWYAQLWAESLGKLHDNNGKTVRTGQTPVKALGVTDQHSLLQLYVEGPLDKVIIFLTVEEHSAEFEIPHNPCSAETEETGSYLVGHTLGGLLKAECRATAYALAQSGQLNMTVTLPVLSAFTMGQLLYFFELQTALAGILQNIDPFNQPGVEQSKRATFALLGRPGYDGLRQEILSTQDDEKYII